MTTRLSKPVKRVVPTRRDGELIVTLTAEGVLVREKGRRTSYGPLPYGKLLLDAVRMHVEAVKRAKAEARKAKRAGGGR